MSRRCFGRNGVILELVVRWLGALRPTFIEMDVAVIMPLGLGAKELAEEAVEGLSSGVFEAGYKGEYYLIKACNYD